MFDKLIKAIKAKVSKPDPQPDPQKKVMDLLHIPPELYYYKTARQIQDLQTACKPVPKQLSELLDVRKKIAEADLLLERRKRSHGRTKSIRQRLVSLKFKAVRLALELERLEA